MFQDILADKYMFCRKRQSDDEGTSTPQKKKSQPRRRYLRRRKILLRKRRHLRRRRLQRRRSKLKQQLLHLLQQLEAWEIGWACSWCYMTGCDPVLCFCGWNWCEPDVLRLSCQMWWTLLVFAFHDLWVGWPWCNITWFVNATVM